MNSVEADLNDRQITPRKEKEDSPTKSDLPAERKTVELPTVKPLPLKTPTPEPVNSKEEAKVGEQKEGGQFERHFFEGGEEAKWFNYGKFKDDLLEALKLGGLN